MLVSFLVAQPAVLVLLVLEAVVVGTATWLLTRRAWKKRADAFRTAAGRAQDELGEASRHSQQLAQQLTAQREHYQQRLAYWLTPNNCLAQGWAVASVQRVRRHSWYEPDESRESQAPRGPLAAVIDPVTPPPTKRPTTEADYATALVLTKNTGAGKFTIVVGWLAELATFPREPLAVVDVEPVTSGWRFDIPRSSRGTGALSAAFDYLLARAKRERIPNLTAPLTSIWTEAHRIRLRRFYLEKYGFTYLPSLTNPNGYVTKQLG